MVCSCSSQLWYCRWYRKFSSALGSSPPSFQEDHQQQFFLGHSDMISCLAVHHTEDNEFLAIKSGTNGNNGGSASTIVCSGEFGARPRVCVWCAETCEVRFDRTCHTLYCPSVFGSIHGNTSISQHLVRTHDTMGMEFNRGHLQRIK